MNSILNGNKLKQITIIILTFLASITPIVAQNLTQSEYKILGISVEGNKIADAETILGLCGIYQGDKIKYPGDNDKFQTAINNLWKRGQFQEIRFVVDRVTNDGIFLKVIVKELPRLRNIIIAGNDKIAEKDILTAVSKAKGDIIKRYDLNLIEKKIKAKYAEEGLQYTKVNASLVPTDSNLYSDLRVEITEGVKFYASAVEFVGNTNFTNKQLSKTFDDTHTKSWWQFWRSSKFNPDKYELDKKLLKDFYKKNGFVNFVLLKDTLIFNPDEGEVIVRVFVDEGKKFYLRNVNFKGNTVYTAEQLLPRLDMVKGDVMNMEKFEFNLFGNQNQTDATSMYMDHGYLQANMQPNYKQDGDSIDVEIIVVENDRYKLGKVEIAGNTRTREKVVRRELYTRPGDYFDRSAIINSIRALGVTGFFNTETLQPDVQPSKDEKNTVDVTYKVEEKSNDQLNLQFGYAGTFGLTISAGVIFNNFALDDPIVSGAGQTLSAKVEVGNWSQYRTISLGIMEPWLFDVPTTVGFNVFHQYLNYSSWKLARTGISLNFGRRFRWPDNYFRGDWVWRTQYNDIKDVSSDYYRPGQYWENNITQTFSRTNWNNSFFPSVGSSFSLQTSLSLGAIKFGTTDFFKNELRYSFVSPIWSQKGQDKLVFYVDSRLGYVTGLASDSAMSPVELYHMGGNGLGMFSIIPLRGYDDDVFGVFYDASTGSTYTGGKMMAKFSAELRYAIAMEPMPIYVYAFADAGNLWRDIRTMIPSDLRRAAGLGIQLMIPQLGNIGFSYGYGFDNPSTNSTLNLQPSGWKFIFHLGGI
ncbi:MAG: outer membrane protein assembly factor BamA [Ignavibacteria bacterium]|jgi:outer membrane protein insertion porin family|nr:outer membrane protein assembly factor BamA [Ignavibacteria bacterium]